MFDYEEQRKETETKKKARPVGTEGKGALKVGKQEVKAEKE